MEIEYHVHVPVFGKSDRVKRFYKRSLAEDYAREMSRGGRKIKVKQIVTKDVNEFFLGMNMIINP